MVTPPARLDAARVALFVSLCGAAVSVSYPTVAAACWSLSAYLYVRHLRGAQTVTMPWTWV